MADAVVRDANAQLGAHQQIRGVTIWPDEDLPRTHTLKVKKRIVLDRLAELESGAPRRHAASRGCSHVAAWCSDRRGHWWHRSPNLPIASVLPDSRLSTDLNMDSLARIELLGVIEEELGTFVDDGDLDPDTTVAQLTALVDAAKEQKHDTGIFGWPLSPVARAAGILIQTLLLVPDLLQPVPGAGDRPRATPRPQRARPSSPRTTACTTTWGSS